MKSFSIKLLNKNRAEYLLKCFEKSSLDFYLSEYKFKTYENIIIHYKDENGLDDLYEEMYRIFKMYIEKFHEENIIKGILGKNYFYLNIIERDYIYLVTKKILELPESKIGNINRRLKLLIINYIKENKKIYVDGFVLFRLKEYIQILEEIIDVSVCSYLER